MNCIRMKIRIIIVCLGWLFVISCGNSTNGNSPSQMQEGEDNQFVECPICNKTGICHYIIEDKESTCVGCSGKGLCDTVVANKILQAQKTVSELCQSLYAECSSPISPAKNNTGICLKRIREANKILHNMELHYEHTNDTIERVYIPILIGPLKECIGICEKKWE